MLFIRVAVGMTFAITLLAVFGHYIPRSFENAFLSEGRKPFLKGIYYDLTRRWWVFLLPILLFSLTSIGSFVLPRVQFDEMLKAKYQQAPKHLKAYPFDEPISNPLADILDFGFGQGIIFLGILVVVLLTILTRFLGSVYHSFLVRAMIFYTIIAILFHVVMFVVNPLYHTLMIDYFFQPFVYNVIFDSLFVCIITLLITEQILSLSRLLWGHKAKTKVLKGTYSCINCLNVTIIDENLNILPPCPKCENERFIKQK